MNINDLISDEEIETCIDGSSSTVLIRSIINLTQVNNLVNEESFADVFAFELKEFIDADPASLDYMEANEVNWDWGYNIAQNINELLINKWIK
jgi:hypothetical protein